MTETPDLQFRLLVCRPVNIGDWPADRQAWWARILQDVGHPPEIYPGSIDAECFSCGITIAVGPRQQDAITWWEATARPYRLACFLCGVLAQREFTETHGAQVQIGNLGNPGSAG